MNPVSTGNMRAQSISIQLSDRTKCNGGCLFCISQTTPGCGHHEEKVKLCNTTRLKVGLGYAQRLGATHAILTGKADPTQEEPWYLDDVVATCRQYLPLVDMHTNGYLLQSGKGIKAGLLEELQIAGLTMVTFSIASFDQETNRHIMKLKVDHEQIIRQALDLGLLVRCSVVINKQGVNDYDSLMAYIKTAGNLGVHQVVVREVWVPETYSAYNHQIYQWNKDNQIRIADLESRFVAESEKRPTAIKRRDPLPWGTNVFAVGGIFDDADHGVNVTFSQCDEGVFTSVIKSIVHKPDGHGYRNWDHNGDILY